jgi:hypothetical protein
MASPTCGSPTTATTCLFRHGIVCVTSFYSPFSAVFGCLSLFCTRGDREEDLERDRLINWHNAGAEGRDGVRRDAFWHFQYF